MPDKLTDSEIVKDLNEAEDLENVLLYCKNPNKEVMIPIKITDIRDLINRLQAENERSKNDLAISKKETKRYQESYITAKKESTKNHKELLKSKVFKYVRNPNHIYTIMDFQDGEILRFYDYPEKPNALASGYYKFQGKNDIRLLHISEVKELSYDEIKAEAYKEFAERLKKEAFKINYCGSSYNVVDTDDIDNLLNEMVGEDNEKT